MNRLFFYRIVFISALAVTSPLVLFASVSINMDETEGQEITVAVSPMFQDSTSARKRSSDNARENQKPSQDDRDNRLKEVQRRAIKEVPRSIPKLKPKPVTERINIKRPPIKLPKKGLGANIRL